MSVGQETPLTSRIHVTKSPPIVYEELARPKQTSFTSSLSISIRVSSQVLCITQCAATLNCDFYDCTNIRERGGGGGGAGRHANSRREEACVNFIKREGSSSLY